MMKKTLSLLLALLMVLSLLPTAAFADTNDFSAKFSVVGVKAANGDEKTEDNIGAGDTVTVAFVIEKNPGTGAFQFQLSFDKSKLLLKKLVAAGDISGYSVLGNTKVDSEKYGMFSGDADEDTTETGALANLTFEVLDTVAGGEILTIDVEDASMKVGTVDGDPVPATITPCTITVAGGGENPNVPVTGVTLDKTTLELTEGQEEQLTATVVPETATTRTVKWTSDSEQVTVDENGKVKALYYTAGSTGKATVTVTTDDGGYTAVCKVTVKHGELTYKSGEAASCTKEGQKAHWFCDTCGRYYLVGDGDTVGAETTPGEVIIPTSPHTLEPVAEKAATCTTGGNVAYWKCSVCGAMFKDANGDVLTNEEGVKTPANGHSYSSEWSKDANYHWHECTVCQEKEPGTENPHDWKVVVKKDYAEGSPTHEVQCSVCGALKNEAHEGDDITTAWEHDKDHHWNVYGCGTIMNKEFHTWDTGKVTKAATCTEKGETTYTCSKCGETKTEEDIPAKGHAEVLKKTDAIPATCTTGGNDAYWTCPDCGTYFSDEGGKNVIEKDSWIKEKLGHKYTDESLRVTWGGDGKSAHIELTCANGCGTPWEKDVTLNNGITAAVKTPATCTEVGTTTYTAKVTNPTTGKDLTAAKDVQDLSALGHEMTKVADKAVTCTEDGNNEYYVCKRCKGVFKDALGNDSTTVEAETIKAPGTHDFGGTWSDSGDGHYQKCRRTGCDAKSDPKLHTSWSKPHKIVWAPDHKSATATYPACEVCGVEPTKEAIVTIEVTTEPTCRTIGKRTYTATQKLPDSSTRSNFYYEDIPALGHDYTDDSLKALWTPDGKIVTVTFTCSRNGKHLHTLKLELEKNDVTAAVKIPATCTEMGTTTYTAKVTNPTTQHEFTLTKDVQDIALLPHTMVKTEDKAATCVAAGNNAYWTCSVCKGVFKDELGKTATTVEAETLPIDPANHTGNTELRDAVTATCNMSGHEADTYCKDCGVLLSRGATIPATGKHTYGEDGRCTSCGNVNPTAGVNTDDIKAADTVNGKPVSPDNSGKVIASDDGKTVIKTPAAADDNTVQQVKDALTGGSVTLYVDNRKTEALTGSDGGVAALEALAASASGERKQELEKLAEALKALLSDSGRKNAAGQMVYDGEMQLCDANGVPVAELVQSPNSIQVTLPITEAQYQAMQGKNVCVLRSSTDASGAAAVTELSATVGGSQGARVLSFSTDKGGALALAVYETVSSGGSSGGSGSSTAPRTADAGVTVWCALLGISALLGTALVAKKRRQA